MSIFTLCFVVVNLTAQEKGPKAMKKTIPAYQIGDKVQDFTLPNINGEKTALSSFKDAKGYIIVFTSNVCPFAVANEERLVSIHKEMFAKGYPVIAINPNIGDEENLTAMKAKAMEANFTFAYLKDSKSLYKKFGATKTPQVFLLDQNMTLQYTGSIDDSAKDPSGVEEKYLVNAVNAIMNNKTPNPNVTKSIGCGIKAGGSDARRGGPKGPPSPEKILADMDANKDGKISKDEARGPLAGDFERLDADKDGALTVAELSKIKPRERAERKQ